MTVSYHDRLLKVTDLVDKPGASRRVTLAMAVPDGLELPLVDLVEPIRITGVLESVVDGILLRGELSVDVNLSCARCLAAVEAVLDSDVVELYRDPDSVAPDDEPVEGGYELRDGHIDLDAVLRDTLAPSIPVRPLCDDACRGLCAQCGANRNEAECGCEDVATDARWTVLEGLSFPDEPPTLQPSRTDENATGTRQERN